MKKIPLTQDKFALVDDEDYAFLSQWKWCFNIYALRSEKRSETGRQKRGHIQMHRVVMDCPGDKLIDHINGDKLDNRKSNLRFATQSENMRNRKIAARTKSGYKGVWFNSKRNKYIAYIKYKGQSKVLGSFDSAIEAARTYNVYAQKYWGEFARLNIL